MVLSFMALMMDTFSGFPHGFVRHTPITATLPSLTLTYHKMYDMVLPLAVLAYRILPVQLNAHMG